MAGAGAVLEYNLVSYRRTWRGTVLSSFLLPVLFVVGFGLGVGSMVNRNVFGEPYLWFLIPGMIATTGMQVALGEAMFPVMAKFEWIRTYHAMTAAPLSVGAILLGDMVFLVIRVVIAAAVFLGIAALFGAVRSWWSLAVLPATALLGVAVAAPVFAFTATRESGTNYFAFLQRFVVIPMTLFAGVYYPVTNLPALVQPLVWVSPLWHGVELCRAATQGHAEPWALAGHVGYLLAWAAVGLWFAVRLFRRRLSD
jgi:lipooligosaccharide transport system permease protein